MSNDPPADPRIGTGSVPTNCVPCWDAAGWARSTRPTTPIRTGPSRSSCCPPQFARRRGVPGPIPPRVARRGPPAGTARHPDPRLGRDRRPPLHRHATRVGAQTCARLVSSYGPMPPARAVAIVEQVASALDAAHAATVSSTVTSSRKTSWSPVTTSPTSSTSASRTPATIRRSPALGNAIGSYGYMAPERFDNVPVTNRADVYSLACVLHEILTGEPPFAGSRPSQLIKAHTLTPPPRTSTIRAGIPTALDDVIARGMAKNPAGALRDRR